MVAQVKPMPTDPAAHAPDALQHPSKMQDKSNGKQHKPRRKKKSKKQRQEALRQNTSQDNETDNALDDVEIEYVTQGFDTNDLKSMAGMDKVDEATLEQFSNVFKHFDFNNDQEEEDQEIGAFDNANGTAVKAAGEEELGQEEEDENEPELPLSKKKLKKLQRLSVAELKQLVKRPETVEWWDVTAADPKLLVSLKSYRNTVPVPAHWSQKRKYLQGKRGIEKPPWELPDFIKDTGIMEMREAVREKEDAARLKTKTRERVAPKMGKLDIDYQKLHDAFFRFQTKPKFTIHGELYYEGKEFETKLKEKKPGHLSEELKQALNMPPLAPPPWLISMQRYGPPPSYPNLKIPGLNAPIPDGAQWGYHPGGWGRPPVDEFNRPLYGDVFGVTQQEVAPPEIIEPVDKVLWGELESEEEYEEEEEEEEEQEEEKEQEEADQDHIQASAVSDVAADGYVTPSGLSSVASGLETPEFIELRKDAKRPRDDDDKPKQLYHVIPEVEKNISGFMGSQHGYDLSRIDQPTTSSTNGRSRRKGDNVEVAIDPSELENLDESTLRAKYDAQMKLKMPAGAGNEDLSDMIAEHAASRQAKKQKQEHKKDKKEFKF